MRKSLAVRREITLDDSYDVVVAGGGPAGCMAAASAAREGARTLLVEATGCLGGMATAGMVPAWCGFHDGEKHIHRGLADRVLQGLYGNEWQRLDPRHIDCERLKRIYDDIVTGFGVTVSFHTMVTGVEMDDEGVVDAILIANKAGLSAVRARVYVDCTGDGDLAAWAGARFEKGDEDGDMQPVTLCYLMSDAGVAAEGEPAGFELRRLGEEDPEFSLIGPRSRFAAGIIPLSRSVCGFNCGHVWGVDGTDPASVSRCMLEGRRLVHQHQQALAKHAPGRFGNAFLTATAPLLGVRETRRIIGDYYLTLADHQALRSFDDEIARSSFGIDVHASWKQAQGGGGKIDHRTLRKYQPGESHGIPYRCLTPVGLRNMLVAGRCVSSDRYANGSIRVMPPCMSMGEAAGLAAALAVREDSPDIHAVDVVELRGRLKKLGAYLP